MLRYQGVPDELGHAKSAEKDLVIDFGTLGCNPARFTNEALNTNLEHVAQNLDPKAAVGEGFCWRKFLAGECCNDRVR